MAGTDLRGEPPPPRIEGSIDLWSAPSHLLRRCHQRAQELFKAALAPLGITAQQLSVLYALVEQPGLNQQRLAVVTGWDRNTLAAMLRRLAAQQWIERRRDPGDARAALFTPTAAGEALLARALPLVAEVQERVTAPLSPSERTQLLGALQRMRDDLV